MDEIINKLRELSESVEIVSQRLELNTGYIIPTEIQSKIWEIIDELSNGESRYFF